MTVSKKIAIFLSALVGLGAAYTIVRSVKKTKKEIAKEEETLLEGLGVAEENEDGDPTEKKTRAQIVKKSFVEEAFMKAYDLDGEMVEDPTDTGKEMVYVKENQWNGRKRLEMILPLEDYVSDRNAPRVSEFLRGINSELKDFLESSDITARPVKILEGYLAKTFRLEDDDITIIIQIPPEVYKAYKTDDRDGLSKFYEAYQSHETEASDYVNDWLANSNFYEPDGNIQSEETNIFLAYKLSWPIDEKGITVEQSVEILNQIVYKIEMKGKIGELYEKVMFLKGDSFTEYYSIKDGKLRISDWSY